MQPQHQRQAPCARAALVQGAAPSSGGSCSATLPAAHARWVLALAGYATQRWCLRQQISERDVRILRVLGRGASSVVRPVCAGAF